MIRLNHKIYNIFKGLIKISGVLWVGVGGKDPNYSEKCLFQRMVANIQTTLIQYDYSFFKLLEKSIAI